MESVMPVEPLKYNRPSLKLVEARRRFGRRITWIIGPFAVVWLTVWTGIGIEWREWFGRHDNILLLMCGVMIAGFLAPAIVVSRRLSDRYGLVCRKCGNRFWISDEGYCRRCSAVVFEDG
jgi:hypothetical protein